MPLHHLTMAVKVLDLAAERVVDTIALNAESITAMAFSPDGKLLATSTPDRVAVRHKCPLRFSPDSMRLATEGGDITVVPWNIAARREALRLSITAENRTSVESREANRMTIGIHEHAVRVWDSSSGKLMAVLQGHQNVINALAFSPDGTRLATGGEDSLAKIDKKKRRIRRLVFLCKLRKLWYRDRSSLSAALSKTPEFPISALLPAKIV